MVVSSEDLVAETNAHEQTEALPNTLKGDF